MLILKQAMVFADSTASLPTRILKFHLPATVILNDIFFSLDISLETEDYSLLFAPQP